MGGSGPPEFVTVTFRESVIDKLDVLNTLFWGDQHFTVSS